MTPPLSAVRPAARDRSQADLSQPGRRQRTRRTSRSIPRISRIGLALSAVLWVGLSCSRPEVRPQSGSGSHSSEAASKPADTPLYSARSSRQQYESFGGTAETERATRLALSWLNRQQHSDGYWSIRQHEEVDHPENGFPGFEIGVTGLVLLAFQAAGYSHVDGSSAPQPNEYSWSLKRATDWLLAQQNLDAQAPPEQFGVFGSTEIEAWVYNQAYATLALLDLYEATADRNLEPAVQAAVEWILRSQNPGFGWKYGYQNGENDTSVTGAMLTCLTKALRLSQRDLLRIDSDQIQSAMEGGLNWIDRVTSASSGIVGYEAPGDPGSQLANVFGDPYPFEKPRLRTMTAVATEHQIRIRSELGQDSESVRDTVKRSVDLLMTGLPEWRVPQGKLRSTINFYYWFHGSNALYQYGGPEWKIWNAALQEALVTRQNRDADQPALLGSWDPKGEWGPAGGRVTTTALGALTLQVYYREPRSR